MAIKLRPTPEYRAAKRELSLSARIALRFVEDAIKADPDNPAGPHLPYSHPLFPGLELTIVENGALLVAFHRLNRANVSLDLVIDRRSPPPWYSVE